MAKTFTFPFSGNPAALLQRARTSAEKQGAQFSGDAQRGTFSGMGIKGRYEVAASNINVTIDDKPFVIPWSVVENQLKQFFR